MKKGFVFMETLIVLVVLSVSLVGIYKTYINISSNINNRMYFDNISDLYKTDILRSEVILDTINVSENVVISKDNCTTYMNSTCTSLFDSLRVEKIYINNELLETLNNNVLMPLNNSMVEYLDTINKETSKRYIIVNYKYGNKNYYASLRI